MLQRRRVPLGAALGGLRSRRGRLGPRDGPMEGPVGPRGSPGALPGGHQECAATVRGHAVRDDGVNFHLFVHSFCHYFIHFFVH